jgi:hypothetical protein
MVITSFFVLFGSFFVLPDLCTLRADHDQVRIGQLRSGGLTTTTAHGCDRLAQRTKLVHSMN